MQSQGATSPPKAQKKKEKSPEVQKNSEKSLPKRTKQDANSSLQTQLPGEKQKPTDKEAIAKQSEKAAYYRSKLVNKQGKNMKDMSLMEMEAIWQKAKKK